MTFLFSKLKKHLPLVLVIIAVLFGQAIAELSLPDYMANIVNVGISKGGVDTSYPLVLTKDSMDKLSLFMTEEDKNFLLNSYNLAKGEEGKLVRKIKPLLNNKTGEDFYSIKDLKEEEAKKLTSIISKALIIKGAFDGTISGENMGNMPSNINNSSLGNMNFKSGEEAYSSFKSLPLPIKDTVLKKIDEGFSKLPPNILEQGTGRVISYEYEKLGVDRIKLQNIYMRNEGLKMMAIALLALLASLIVGFIASRIAADFGKEVRVDLFSKVMSFSNKEYNKFSTASLITRSNNDIQQVQNMLVMLLRIVFFAPLLGLGGIYKAIKSNVSMAWIIGLAVVLIITIVLLLFLRAMPLFKKVQTLVDKLQLVTREILNGLMVIRAFVTRDYEEERFKKANRELTDTNQSIANVMVLMNPILMLLMNGVMLMIIWVGAHQIDLGRIEVGDMMAFIQYAMQIIMSFLMITMVSIMLPRAQISLSRIKEVLDEETSIVNKEGAIHLEDEIGGNIEFKNVYFRFENAPKDALEDINLKINRGEITAFIGSTGSGKSTLVSLIPRFYDVTRGSILLDGIDIRDIDIKDLRNKIGYIPQKANLFTGTVLSNMKIGKNADVSQDRIKDSLIIARAKEFVEVLENKKITQGGSNVSGGQKQRLSIARAIASKPQIYIFDDSFSALDFKTDFELRKALKNEAKDATMIIVAQRIGTILKADKIVVLDEGKIVGIGKHEDLLKTNRVYREIASSQLRKEDLA